jgi:flagellar biosynthetic protein FlhB
VAEDMGDKTEQPTHKKLGDARDKGQIPKSLDLSGAVDLIGAALLLASVGALLFTLGGTLVRDQLVAGVGPEALGNGGGSSILMIREALFKGGLAIVPFMIAAGIIAAVSHILQVGFQWSSHPLTPDLNRLNPITGFSRVFGTRGVVKGLLSALKLVLIGIVAFLVIRKELAVLAALPSLGLASGMMMIAVLAAKTAAWVLVFLLLVGVADYGFNWWQHRKDLRMTKQEVKDEHKDMEGDPYIKGRRMKIMRQLAQQRAQTAVPKADVVITNPTHFSVAIQYDISAGGAPKVVAKGVDFLAFEIRKIAKAHGVPILERPPLARALYYAVDVGGEVPPEQYQAVAEVLAFVYRLRQKAAA